MSLDPNSEIYYREFLNDFGLGRPESSYVDTFRIPSLANTVVLNHVPNGVDFVTVRVNNILLYPTDYTVVGSLVQFMEFLNVGDLVVVAYEI